MTAVAQLTRPLLDDLRAAPAARSLRIARRAVALGDVAEATAAARVTLAQERDHAGGWFLLGNAAALAGDLQEALECLDEAVRLAPSWVDARVRRARLLQWCSRYAEARSDLDVAIAGCRGVDPELLAERGFVRRYLGDLAGAARDYRQALRHVAPGSPRATVWSRTIQQLEGRLGAVCNDEVPRRRFPHPVDPR